MDNYDEFEDQLQQEKLEKEKEKSKKTRKDEDGTVYEFDEIKKAWFPKIDDFFIANYQMNYGGTPANISTSSVALNELLAKKPNDINSEEYRIWYEEYCCLYKSQEEEVSKNEKKVSDELEKFLKNKNDDEEEDKEIDTKNSKSTKTIEEDKEDKRENLEKLKAKKEKAKRKQAEPAWCKVDEGKNTNVYVCGLPEETTEEEFVDLMSKVGLLAIDPISKLPKVKLYKGEDGMNKGDARCCYIKPESVQLALDIIDGSDFHGHRIHVERAQFEMKGTYDPGKKRRKLSKVERKKMKESQEKLLGWTPEDEVSRPAHERIVVIKNVFDAAQLKKDPSQVGEIMVDMQDEAKKFGKVKKVTVYDRNVEGVVTVAFKTPAEADACVAAFQGRWFDKRLLSASNWDGRSKYLVEESEEEMEERLKKWHSYLTASEEAGDDRGAQVVVGADGEGQTSNGRIAEGDGSQVIDGGSQGSDGGSQGSGGDENGGNQGSGGGSQVIDGGNQGSGGDDKGDSGQKGGSDGVGTSRIEQCQTPREDSTENKAPS